MPEQINLTESCAVALFGKHNYATQSPINTTSNATINATDDLLSLSARVLARNKRNSERNYDATDKLRSVATSETRIDVPNSNKDKLYGFTLEKLREKAADGWLDIHDDPFAISAYAKILYEQKLMREGQVPPSFTAKTFCMACNKQVPVPPALVNGGMVQSCMWNHIH